MNNLFRLPRRAAILSAGIALLTLCAREALAQTPGFVITSPPTGSVFAPGQVVTLLWTGGDPAWLLTIYLLDRDANTVVDGVTGVANSGAFDYTIPSWLNFGGPCGRTYRWYVENVQRTSWAYGDPNQFTVVCPPADSVGPVTLNLTAVPSPVSVDSTVILDAIVDDSTTGGSNIASAEYSITGGSFAGAYSPMSGTFNTSATAGVTASVPALSSSNLYTLCARGTDSAGNTGAPACVLLPVYDPSAGFATGGGTIHSTEGADYFNPTAAGTANFGFVSKYQKGASTPTGNLAFQFHTGDLTFKSISMDWLVITGQPRAQFQGTGTINGVSVCKFQVDAWDESFGTEHRDAFGLKIYGCNSGSAANGDRYSIDAAPLKSGSIIIHQ